MTLTIKDLAEIERIVDEKLDEKLKNLPTRDEFFTAMSELMGEVQTSRQEQTILSHHSSGHQKRLEVLEDLHPGGRHV